MLSLLHAVADGVIKRIYRSPLYYGRFNNTLSFRINQAYLRYARACSARYAAKRGTGDLHDSPFITNAALCLHGVFPVEKTRAYSATITQLIARCDRSVHRTAGLENLAIQIRSPLLTLGTDLLDVLRAPEVDRALRAFFRGYYRIESIGASRSLPSKERSSSWLWHSDSFPPYTCKLFLHLTPATADRGATEFMSLADTMAYRRAGYFGQYRDERYASLEDFAQKNSLPYRPQHFDAEPGDATLFNMNFFHRAVAPRTAFRDIVSFYFLPSPIPWEEHFAQFSDYVTSEEKKSGFPKNPRIETAQSLRPT